MDIEILFGESRVYFWRSKVRRTGVQVFSFSATSVPPVHRQHSGRLDSKYNMPIHLFFADNCQSKTRSTLKFTDWDLKVRRIDPRERQKSS